MTLQHSLSNLTTRNNTVGSFTLTKLWIEKAEFLEISATAVSVMTALLWHYNPTKKYVFPHQDTIAKRTKRSVATVKRALTELKKCGFIVSTRTRNGNLYAFTQKFFDLFAPTETQPCTISQDKNEPCMNMEHIKEQKKQQHGVVVSFQNFSKGVEEETSKGTSRTADSVSSEIHNSKYPLCLLKKLKEGKIQDIKKYWGSLRPQVKKEYWQQDREEAEAEARKQERKRAEAEEKARQEAEELKRREELARPIEQQYSREQAIRVLYNMRKFTRNIETSMWYPLVTHYNLDLTSIYAMSKEEIEALEQ